jgi:LysR family nitrogen assimilation transcriptional regulator
MNLSQLSYFISVARLGGFNVAARTRHVSQSALSRQIALLEEEIGAPLFERGTRGVMLTAAGTALKERAERVLLDVSRIKGEVLTEVDQPTGELGLGMAQSVARLFGADILQRYLSAYPRVHLHVVEEISDVLISRVETGEIDVAIVTDDAVTRSMSSRRLAREPIALIGAPSLFVDLPARITPVTAAGLRLIVPRHASGSRAALQASLATQKKSVSPYLEVETVGLSVELAKAGLGYLVLPFCAVQKEMVSGVLTARPIAGLTCQWTVVWSAERAFTAAPRKLVQLIAETATELIRDGRWAAK